VHCGTDARQAGTDDQHVKLFNGHGGHLSGVGFEAVRPKGLSLGEFADP
jgi:hypothetical protein